MLVRRILVALALVLWRTGRWHAAGRHEPEARRALQVSGDRRLPHAARWRVRLKRRHVFGKTDPRVLVPCPDRLLRFREARIRECTDSDPDEVGHPRRLPIHIRSASATEMEAHGKTTRGPALEDVGCAALDAHAAALVEDRDAEGAARPTLAFEAVTHGYPLGVTGTCEFELPAMAASRARIHCVPLDVE